MDAPRVQQFEQALAKQIEELGMETLIADGAGEGQIGQSLRTMLPIIGSQGDAALTEILVTELDEDLNLLYFYSTMIMEIGPGYEALKEMLLDWNLECPAGAFGIFRQGRQFYHKYTLPFPKDTAPEALADQAMVLLELLCEIISERFPEAVKLSGHG